MTTSYTMNPRTVPASFGFIITKLAFKKRFPANKWLAARTAATTNSQLADFFEDYDLSSYVDVRRAAANVQALTDPAWPASFRLTSGEVVTVLAECVDPVELPGSVRVAFGLPEVPL